MPSATLPTLVPSYPALVRFAIPVMLAAAATPLMGMVDMAILGRLGDPAIIAAAGVGATLFTMLYWCFSFLRFTTTAQVAQAIGRADPRETLLAGLRPMLVAAGGGILLWILQWPLGWTVLRFLDPPAKVLVFTQQYFDVRIWSAPVTLLGYAQFAWLIGHGRTRAVMLLQVGLNALNSVFALLFVLVFGWGIRGAAWATVASECCIGILAAGVMLRQMPVSRWRDAWPGLRHAPAWRTLFSANLDIMIRTLALTAAFALMTQRGGTLGVMALAANQILIQALLLAANVLDGFATAAEVFGARAIGAASRAALIRVVGRNAVLSFLWSITIALALLAVEPAYLAVMTADATLQRQASTYWSWVAWLPVICVWAFFWDGVYMGAMRTRLLRDSMLASVGVYVAAMFWLSARWGNHGIWAAMMVFMAARAVLLSLAWPALRDSV